MPEPIRVLWLIKGLGPGGAEGLLASMARVRDRERFDYQAAYLLPWKDTLASKLREAGVAVHCLDVTRAWDLRWLWRLRRLLLNDRYDVIHFHSPYVAGLARLLVATLPGRRRPVRVATEHNVWWSYSWPTRIVNALTAPLDRVQFAVSDDVRSSIPKLFRGRVRTVVHGLLLDEARARAGDRARVRRELGLDDDRVVVCTIANLRAQKNYPALLVAAKQVIGSGLPVTFLAVGQGPLEDDVRRMHRELGLGDDFLLLGYREDALSVLAASDIFVLASLHEGFPIAVMEALAMGVPVVATAVGGIPQAVRPGVEGAIVPPGDPQALAGSLLELIKDPALRRRMARAAAARGETYDIRAAAEAIEDAYLSVVPAEARSRR